MGFGAISTDSPNLGCGARANNYIYILRAGANPDSMEHRRQDLSGLPPLEGQGALFHHYHRRASAGGGVVHVAAPVKSDASFQQAAQQTAHASCNASSFSSWRPAVPVVPVVPVVVAEPTLPDPYAMLPVGG